MPRHPEIEADARARILAAAAEVFSSTGFSGARVDDIAARAGVNKAMLYYHVGDKERLYATVLVDTVERGLGALREAIDEAQSPADKLRCVFDAFAEIGDSNPHLIPMMLREVASGGATLPDEMLLRMAGVFRVVADVLAEGRAAGDFRETDPLLTHVSMIGSMMFLVASQPIRARLAKIAGPQPRHSLPDLATHTANLFLHGVETGKSKAAAKRNAAKKKSRSRK